MRAQLERGADFFERPRIRFSVLIGWYLAAVFLTFLPVLRFLHSGTTMDYHIWYEAGRAWWERREIYEQTGTFVFMYPPGCAFLLAWPSLFGKTAFIFLLSLVSSLAWFVAVRALASMLGHKKQTFVLLTANLLVSVYIWSSYHLGQPSIVLFALMLGTFIALQKKRGAVAGALLALAVAIKAFPLLALPYLVWRRHWTAIVSLLISLVCLLFLFSLPRRGPAQARKDFQSWRAGMLRYDSAGIAQRQLRGYSWKNQSAFGLMNRMLRPVSAEESATPEYANLTNLSFTTVNYIILAFAFVVGLSFLVVMPRTISLDTAALEFACLLMLILLFTPLAFGYLFLWLMLPLALVLQRWLSHGDLVSSLGFMIAVTLLLVTAVTPRVAQTYGSVFFAALVLYVTMAVELWREKSMAVRVPGAARAPKATPR